MDFSIKSGSPEKQRTACVIVGIFSTRRLSNPAKTIDIASKQHLSALIRRGDMDGDKGQHLLLHNVPGVMADRVLLIGCGKEREIDDRNYRAIIENSVNALNKTGALEGINYLSELNIKGRDGSWKIKQAVEIAEHTLYKFNELKSKNKQLRRPLRKITFTVPTRRELTKCEPAIKYACAIAKGIKLTRDLGNYPSNICTPNYLAEQAIKLAKNRTSLTVNVLEESDMEKLGMGSLLSVSQGSSEPAKLITLEYRAGKKSQKPVVIIGKGVTFDTGGISIKPSQAMDEMKYDMCGAASVMGTMAAVTELKLPINVVGIIPATENMPSGDATNPGDIFTSMSGQTVEVLNTDAEGRLILCDAITYSKKYNPEVVIDIATLTGACVIALGKHATGLLSNHNPLARELINAGEESGDRVWQLPLWDEYQQQLNSPFADIANIGGREAGTITAACFLSRFAEKLQWAHLDIAGTAWLSGSKKGATGRPVSLLMQYILNKIK
jgi:leucyl aminopeptidase|tara:strand:+ start:2995 stop:4485 length:1491 start_codon:yes stop_codon:yes gene_type:complete